MLRSVGFGLRGRARATWLLSCLLLAGLAACGDDDDDAPAPDAGNDAGEPPTEDGGDPPDPEPDASGPEPDAGADAGKDGGDEPEPEPDAEVPEPDSGVDAGPPPLSLGGLTVSVTPEEHELDLFGDPGHRFWFEVSEKQLEKLNKDRFGGGGGFPDGPGDDIYFPGQSRAYYVDHLLVEDVESKEVADYGKLEVKLVGESTDRAWDEDHIPNIRVDTNEFDKDKRIGTYEHMRFNNGLVGSIFRESLAHSIYRALDYPALQSSHAFIGSNVWGDDVWVPMTLMDMYKRRFCRDNQDLIGGSCDNMWEFVGDLDMGQKPAPAVIRQDRVPESWCQVSDCDNARLIQTMDVLARTQPGEGFKAALNDYVDWDRFHEFQCLSWIMWTGDDPLHNNNNNLVIERDNDHKLVWAPYSVDISAGQNWYTNTPLPGSNMLSRGCQAEPDCWADTIATCEDLIMRFDELNPEELVDALVTKLNDLDMMRYGDDDRAEELRQWFVDRQAALLDELEIYRIQPDVDGNCPGDLIRCGDGGCGTVEACEDRQCQPGLEFCETVGHCTSPDYECFSCAAEVPYYCAWEDGCRENEQACIDACNESGFSVWCAYYDSCIDAQQYCPEDSDGGPGEGGTAGWFGGMGGIGVGGFGMPGGFPGGMAGAPAAGMGIIIDDGP